MPPATVTTLLHYITQLQLQLVGIWRPFSAQIYGYIRDETSGVESYPYPV